MVSVSIVGDDPHPSVHFNHFLPMGHFSRAIVFHSLEIVGVAVFFL